MYRASFTVNIQKVMELQNHVHTNSKYLITLDIPLNTCFTIIIRTVF